MKPNSKQHPFINRDWIGYKVSLFIMIFTLISLFSAVILCAYLQRNLPFFIWLSFCGGFIVCSFLYMLVIQPIRLRKLCNAIFHGSHEMLYAGAVHINIVAKEYAMTIGIGNRGIEIGNKLYPWETFTCGEYETYFQKAPVRIVSDVLRDWRVNLHTQSGQEISIARNYTVY
ncbi:MAG: hypothetical protein ACI4U2_01400, partial [Christensenellaceae bacterium]